MTWSRLIRRQLPFFCTAVWLLHPAFVVTVLSDEPTVTVVYDFVVNGTSRAGTWTVVRSYTDNGTDVSCSGTAQFRVIVPVTYEFVADARYDRNGRLINATSSIDTVGLNHDLRVRAAGDRLVVEKLVRGRRRREVPSGNSRSTTLDFFNPDSVQLYFAPHEEVEYEGIDLEQGTLRTLPFTVERTYSSRFSRPVLRVATDSMELLYEEESLELLYNRATEMGVTVELVIRE
jgi:hypothetical protein